MRKLVKMNQQFDIIDQQLDRLIALEKLIDTIQAPKPQTP